MKISGCRSRLVAAGFALVVGCGASVAATGGRNPSSGGAADDPGLQRILADFDRVQATIRTLSAGFTETTTSHLLKAPIQAKGRLYLTKPSSVLWEYEEPEVMRFAIANDEYVGYFPQRKRAEKSDIHRWSERIFRIFGLGQTSAELGKFYSIRAADPGAGHPGTSLLLLEPKKRRVRKRVEQVKLRISSTTHLPLEIELSGKDGYVRQIQLHDLRINPDLSASLYDIEIPAGVTVTSGTSGLETVRPPDSSRSR
jgi:outer membrane lipoprotein-sorting protein